ncbi:Endoglucanase [Melia azedarach]|uniref:Endoglucanase n=1 Tax=Melia azedarach TaxID=155640 RepID=A0ACC1XL01_MELAZ|nr:Endoglucanase [Melia azedarach]
MLPEGLNKRPLKEIVGELANMHFNCVRLTWSTFMFTRDEYGQANVAQTLDSLGLEDAKQGIAKNNPFVLNMTHVQAYEAVVDELGAQGVMVLLDNHLSKPGWCCSNTDGNGFFGDEFFDPDEWLLGLILVSQFSSPKQQVVAISLRNELRGPRQNVDDWYYYVSDGVSIVNQLNPSVLILVSGLSFDTDLSILKGKPLALGLDNKIVYEVHWYSFSQDQNNWINQPSNLVCGTTTQSFIDKSAFLTYGDNPVPLLLSEFGIDQTNKNLADNFYITCLMAYAAERDLDWALWTLQGSYYLREGIPGHEDLFGALDEEWRQQRNPNFIQRLWFMQKMNQDPNSQTTSYTIFHPESGGIVTTGDNNTRWSYDGDGSPIKSMNTDLCLNVVGDGLPPIISTDCSSEKSIWTTVSLTKMHLAAKDGNGQLLCLQKSFNSSLVLTSKCICIEDDPECSENPQSQWFKFALTNVT